MKDIIMRLTMAAAILCITAARVMAQDVSLPRAAIEADFTRLECSLEIDDAVRDQQSFDLGGGAKLVQVPCFLAAYQGGGIFYAVEGAAPPRLLSFQHWDGKRFAPTSILTEPEFDPESKTMGSFYKGRGIGDCGSMGSWKWTGTEFKLTEYFYKEKCNGRSFSGEKRWQIFPRRLVR